MIVMIAPSWREQRKSPPQWLRSCRSLQLASLGGPVCKHHRDSWQTSCWWWFFANINDDGDGVFFAESTMMIMKDAHLVRQSTRWTQLDTGTLRIEWFQQCKQNGSNKQLERCGVKNTWRGATKKGEKNHLRWGQLGQKMSWTPRAGLPSTWFEIVTSIITTNICSGWFS